MQADDLDALPAAHPQAHLARVFDRHAELVVLAAGRNVRMAAGVDVGVHADRHLRASRAAEAIASMRSISPSDSALMLRRPSSMARASSASDLPTPVKTISAGVNPARSATSISPPELASAAAPEAAQQPGDSQGRVRFQRIVERVRVSAERLVHFAIAGRNHVGAVGVEGGPEAGGKLDERHAAAVQAPLQPVE